MNYAYPSGAKGEVRIEAGGEGYVEFVISDDGTFFKSYGSGGCRYYLF